ncbi:hypothetical protein KP509_16G026200 [Ceratopteris richardii]|uniref:RPA-interacting protein n=1 Tax=Ceratopteris richardii TaxID=49495 RepID=A0A8T2SXH6_CERRI|nr:hypothetical protein KP509_16G026200 [Ceratopteris richardii]KAH7387512.1 hypothetical protein KP509_16G026200 [Ceratopteris richardii]
MANKQTVIRRSPIKSSHVDWKDKLRENCLKRVEKNRSQILWKFRLGGEGLSISEEGVKLAFSNILTDEIDRLKQKANDESFHDRSDPDAMLWEYEPSEITPELGNDDYEQLMISMQNILYKDLQTENQKRDALLLEDYESACEQEDNIYSTMLEELKKSKEDEVICPICKSRKLQQNQSLIFCSCGNIQLNVQHEKVNLQSFKKKLEGVLQQHYDSSCKGLPVFFMDARFSIMALYMQCSLCEAFELVF